MIGAHNAFQRDGVQRKAGYSMGRGKFTDTDPITPEDYSIEYTQYVVCKISVYNFPLLASPHKTSFGTDTVFYLTTD